VVSIAVHLGDVIQRGQAIAEIDTVELHTVSMEFLTAVARARQANDALARQQQLVRERIGAEADLRRAEADAAAQRAALQEAEEHLHFLGLTDRQIAGLRARTSHGEARSTVRSLIDGRVETVNVSIGQVVSGTEDLATVAQLDVVWASLRVYERDAVNVRMGTTVEVTTPGVPDRTFTGTVTFVSAIVDPVTRTFEARVPLANQEGLLRPGMSATATVAVHDVEQRLWVPVDAVQPHDNEHIVFVQVGDRRFAPRVVTVGDERNGFVPVLSGIQPGDPVVIHGAFALRGELDRAALEEE
jgi:cobalt-zinc-cadmium efflux system membrane fusion protein